MRLTEEVDITLRNMAYDMVLKVRGSWDAPGFDLCVDEEYLLLKQDYLNGKLEIDI